MSEGMPIINKMRAIGVMAFGGQSIKKRMISKKYFGGRVSTRPPGKNFYGSLDNMEYVNSTLPPMFKVSGEPKVDIPWILAR